MPLCGRPLDFGKHLLDMVAVQKRYALLTVLGAEFLDYAATRLARFFLEAVPSV